MFLCRLGDIWWSRQVDIQVKYAKGLRCAANLRMVGGMANTEYAKLLEEIRASRARIPLTLDELASAINMHRDTLTRRIANPEAFKLSELVRIADELGMSLSLELAGVEVLTTHGAEVA